MFFCKPEKKHKKFLGSIQLVIKSGDLKDVALLFKNDPVVYIYFNKKEKHTGNAIQKGKNPIWGMKNVMMFDFKSSDREMIVCCKHKRGLLPQVLIGNGVIDIVNYRSQGYYQNQIVYLTDSQGKPSGHIVVDITVNLYLPKQVTKPVSEFNIVQNNSVKQNSKYQQNSSNVPQQQFNQNSNFSQNNTQSPNSFNKQPSLNQQSSSNNSIPHYNIPPQNQPQQGFNQQNSAPYCAQNQQQQNIQKQFNIPPSNNQQAQFNQIPQQKTQLYDDAQIQQQLHQQQKQQDQNLNQIQNGQYQQMSDADIARMNQQNNQANQNIFDQNQQDKKQINFLVNNGYNYPTEE